MVADIRYLVLLALLVNQYAYALRNPFVCSHAHSKTSVERSGALQEQKSSDSDLGAVHMRADDGSSEWRVIAEKDDTVIMQHRDGSIREITISKQ